VEERKAENSIDSHIRPKGKGNSNRTAGSVHVWGEITNDCGKVAVFGSVEVVGVSYSAAQFDGFKWVGVIKRMVFSY
jgi:hypothetical protein